MHSHILCGIDDGAKNEAESIEILKGLHDLGFRRFVATPHIMREYYPNDKGSINRAFDNLGKALKKSELSFTVKAAAEYYGDEALLELLNKDESLLTIGEDYVLFEVSMLAKSSLLNTLIFELKTKGYKPILAHPERYLYYRNELDVFSHMDCDLQVNLLSLSGYYGPEQKKIGIHLIENDIITFLGTDIHRIDQLRHLEQLARDKKLINLLASKTFKNKMLKVDLFT